MKAAKRIPRVQEGKQIMKILVAAVTFFLLVSNAFAADIAWMYVQHRQYETGRHLNRLAFGLIDEEGQVSTDGREVADVQLYAPDGSAVNLLKYRFDSDEEMFGLYDAVRSRWYYSDNWQFDSWFRANFTEPLIPGQYRLKVTTVDGMVAESSFHFKKRVELPVITSRSFKIYKDSLGNVIWKWDIPDDLGRLIFKHQTEARASIDIIKNEKSVAYFFIKIPSHLAYVFIPRHIAEKITTKGDQFGFRILLETKDKNNRTYSATFLTSHILTMTMMTEKKSNKLKK
jgi:hypothetical protein